MANTMIKENTARQIVAAVKDVCGYDINFISTDGIIIASTDEKRVGDFHEIGYRAAQKGETLEVYDNQTYDGAQKGVNIPFHYHGTTAAVIGITGEPDEVRRYARLALRIMRLLLRERDLDASRELKRAEFSHVARTLVLNGTISHSYLVDFLKRKGLSYQDQYRVVIADLPDSSHIRNITALENQSEAALSQIRQSFYGYEFPNRYILIISEQGCQEQLPLLRKLADIPAKVSVGSRQRLSHIHQSYEDARLALRAGTQSFTEFDSLYTELLFSGTPDHVREVFLQKTIGQIRTDDLVLLKTYYENQMSLKAAAEKLFIHKNTLQYRLERIHRQSGLDPRNIQDASILITAMKLADTV